MGMDDRTLTVTVALLMVILSISFATIIYIIPKFGNMWGFFTIVMTSTTYLLIGAYALDSRQRRRDAKRHRDVDKNGFVRQEYG